MVNKKVLVNFLDKILDLPKFAADSSNNGLQVETKSKEVKKIAFAVDGTAESFRKAIEVNADMLQGEKIAVDELKDFFKYCHGVNLDAFTMTVE